MVLADLGPDVAGRLIFIGFMAEVSIVGVIAAAWGIFRLRSTHLRPTTYQRHLRELLAWRLLDEDPTGEYPDAEPLVVAWAHGQGIAGIACGAGIVAAGVLVSCATLCIPLPALPANTSSAIGVLIHHFLVLTLVAIQLFMVGTLAGLFLGYARAFRRREGNPHVLPMRPRFGMRAYRASWLPWLVLAGAVLECVAFALVAPAEFWRASTAQRLILYVLPAIAIGEVVILEGVGRAICRMPLAPLPGPPEAADRRSEGVYTFLATMTLSMQVALLCLLSISHVLAWVTFGPSSASNLSNALGSIVLVETFGGLVLMGLLVRTGGRLGGSRTGWPWRPALGTETAESPQF